MLKCGKLDLQTIFLAKSFSFNNVLSCTKQTVKKKRNKMNWFFNIMGREIKQKQL